jgi:hypothetical protein
MKSIRKPEYTQEDLHRLFEYIDGKLFRKEKTTGSVVIGEEAGFVENTGYRRVSVKNKKYSVHRLIYHYHYGTEYNGMIDHVDGNPSNNRVENLRKCSSSQNQGNRKRYPNKKHNLPKGVFRKDGRRAYFAQIRVKGVSYSLGTYSSPELAHEAYCLASDLVFGDFSRHI